MRDVDGTRHITSLKNEYLKRYVEFDGDSNPIKVYEARPGAIAGDPCLVTKSVWLNGVCTHQLEYEGTWPSITEIEPD